MDRGAQPGVPSKPDLGLLGWRRPRLRVLPITTISRDVGDPGDWPTPPPYPLTRIPNGLFPSIPSSSQIGVGFTHVVLIGVGSMGLASWFC
jgi:hypothetical protein